MKEWKIIDFGDKEINWAEVPVLTIDEYPWYKEGLKQETKVQIAIFNNKIHIIADAKDKYIKSTAKKLNDPVHEDSCFEFFVTPWDKKTGAYFNIEINCTGVLYMSYKDEEGNGKLISQELAKEISIDSSLKNIKDIEEEKDWQLKIVVPIRTLEELSGRKIKKDIWYGNFYRCGGMKDDQYASWAMLEFDRPNFHLPMQFGKLIISDSSI